MERELQSKNTSLKVLILLGKASRVTRVASALPTPRLFVARNRKITTKILGKTSGEFHKTKEALW